ncbi:UNVERIFIED_CONTAM: hypothetical protein FKN15_014038 [Acipenser sinensis]
MSFFDLFRGFFGFPGSNFRGDRRRAPQYWTPGFGGAQSGGRFSPGLNAQTPRQHPRSGRGYPCPPHPSRGRLPSPEGEEQSIAPFQILATRFSVWRSRPWLRVSCEEHAAQF